MMRPWALRCGSPPLSILRTLTFLLGVSKGLESCAGQKRGWKRIEEQKIAFEDVILQGQVLAWNQICPNRIWKMQDRIVTPSLARCCDEGIGQRFLTLRFCRSSLPGCVSVFVLLSLWARKVSEEKMSSAYLNFHVGHSISNLALPHLSGSFLLSTTHGELEGNGGCGGN